MEKAAVKIYWLYINIHPQQFRAARLDTRRTLQQFLRLSSQIYPQIADTLFGATCIIDFSRKNINDALIKKRPRAIALGLSASAHFANVGK